MPVYPFTLSLDANVQVSATDNGYTLSASGPHEHHQRPMSMLTLPAVMGMGEALTQLREGNATSDTLVQALAQEGSAAGEQFVVTLQQLDQRGWLNYAVLPLAVAVPMVATAQLNLAAPPWTDVIVSLSRFAYQRTHDGGMVLESPLSKYRVKLLDWRTSALLAQLAQPQALAQLIPPPSVGPETAYQFLNLLWATGFLTIDAEPAALQLWEFHNLLFHSRSRQGRHDYAVADIEQSLGQWSDFPVVKPPMSDRRVPLPQPNLEVVMQRDGTLTRAIETRASIREYDDSHPMTIEQLSELLYRTARVKAVYTLDATDAEFFKAQFGDDFEWGDLSCRPYPCGGAMYELEIYPVVRRCQDLASGLYHYDPLHHQLAQLNAPDHEIAALITDAHHSSGEQGMPQVLLVITARFGRLFRKYRSLAYALVLKHAGVLQQNLYLVATNMGLAPCALGAGDSDCFARATGLDYVVESSVGEFMLGSLPSGAVEASGPLPADVETSDYAPDVNPMEMGTNTFDANGCPHDAEVDPIKVSPSAPLAAPTSSPSTDALTPSAPIASPAPPAPPTPEPPDTKLTDRIPGFAALQAQTLGDERITIVVLDGDADFDHSCFQGANVSKVFPYWHETPEPITAADYACYLDIHHSDLKKEAKAEKITAAFPEPAMLHRIVGDVHATGIISVMVGQSNSSVPGIAPRCRVINVPLNTSSDPEEFISALNLARAFELALDLGANVIHCAACRPTQTGIGEDLLAQAVKKCQDHNILIVAPAGNNQGDCWCLPAGLPSVLAVGALKDDGQPAKYSNWGGNYELEGILAPGENILAAQPQTEETDRQKGTSLSAPIMSAISALLMSVQRQQGQPIDAEAIRAALLNTAIPCNPADVDEPERCLRGKLNLSGAYHTLTGAHLQIQPQGATDQPLSLPAEQNQQDSMNANTIPSAEPPAATGVDVAHTDDLLTQPHPYVVDRAGIHPDDDLLNAGCNTGEPAIAIPQNIPNVQLEGLTPSAPPAPPTPPAPHLSPATVTPSTAHSGHIYALGTLNYDFGSETRRDTFKQRMTSIDVNGVMVPVNPYDARQMVEHLDRNPDAARALIWTLSLDQNTIYALEPKGPFAGDIYEMLLLMLSGQLEPEASAEFVERISVPARRTSRTVELLSGEVVPLATVHDVRGMYGWQVNSLVDAALTAVGETGRRGDEQTGGGELRQALTAFLNRVYHDLHNVGQMSRDRALNFATTNIFQAASTFAQAIADGRQLDTIDVEKSPFCRLNSDCWDIKLQFFDPEHHHRARKVFRFTIDVSDLIPITLGEVKSWSVHNA